METAKPPRDYSDWRIGKFDRPEDAAYLFGYYLISECRDRALKRLPGDAPPELRSAVENAVDEALDAVCALLEGIFPLSAGPDIHASLALNVHVHDAEDQIIETIAISPNMLDLQIGYWKWAMDRDFRSSS